MKVNIIGGTLSEIGSECKCSGVVKQIYKHFSFFDEVTHYINGAPLNRLPTEIKDTDLIIWMPNISNETEKHYPVKPVGSVLICSKVMREGYTRFDAVSRIFKMHGNAVIEIHKDTDYRYRFCLVDALANEWINTDEIPELCEAIKRFYEFTKSAYRVRTVKGDLDAGVIDCLHNEHKNDLIKLLEINKRLQSLIMTKCGSRFFGNISTRCQKLFPSKRSEYNFMFVSPRNTDKSSLDYNDMILYDTDFDEYYGTDNKPSVDSPCQARLYSKYKNINYMIHGHATIVNPQALTTKNYCLCGDVNEVKEIIDIADTNGTSLIINLKNHGFLLMADTFETLNKLVDDVASSKVIIK